MALEISEADEPESDDRRPKWPNTNFFGIF